MSFSLKLGCVKKEKSTFYNVLVDIFSISGIRTLEMLQQALMIIK